MNSLTAYTVVEQMTRELAARRRTNAARRAAYLTLARVIVQGEDQAAMAVPAARLLWDPAPAA